MLDLRAREMEMTAELVRRRLEELGCTATFCHSDTDVWLEEGGQRFSVYRWREWYRPGLETREDRGRDVARHLVKEASSCREL